MIDATRNVVITAEEIFALTLEMEKNNLLVKEAMNFVNFDHAKYNVLFRILPMGFDSITDLTRRYSKRDKITRYDKLLANDLEDVHMKNLRMYNALKKENYELSVISSIKVLYISTTKGCELSFNNKSHEFKDIFGIKSFGQFDVEFSHGTMNAVPKFEDDPWSVLPTNIALCGYISLIFMCKLYCEYTNKPIKFKYDKRYVKSNIISLSDDDFNTLDINSSEETGKLLELTYYPLNELTIINEAALSGGMLTKFFETVEVKYNDYERSKIHISALSTSHNHTYGKFIEGDVLINKRDIEVTIKIDHTNRDDEEGRKIADEYLTYAVMRFLYIMNQMQKPKQIRAARNYNKEDIKTTTTSRPSHKKKDDSLNYQIVTLIKINGLAQEKDPNALHRKGSKHSYEYEKRGTWCTSKKTGKRYWRNGCICCKGRGSKATHIYDYK